MKINEQIYTEVDLGFYSQQEKQINVFKLQLTQPSIPCSSRNITNIGEQTNEKQSSGFS